MKYISGVMKNKFIHFQIYFLKKHKMKKMMIECSQVFLNNPAQNDASNFQVQSLTLSYYHSWSKGHELHFIIKAIKELNVLYVYIPVNTQQ